MAAIALALVAAVAAPGTLGATAPSSGGPAAAPQEDPAASLYREGREALNAGEYRRAAETLARVSERYPDSEVASASLYWQAFALYRLGELEEALRVLDRQAEAYPEAERRDGRALALRIRGELGRRGDPEAAARVAEVAGPLQLELAGPLQLTEARLSRVMAQSAELAARSAEMMAGLSPGALAAQLAAGELAAAGPAGRARAQEGCPEEEHEIQMAAMNALLMMESERALPVLERVLARRDECSVPLRRQATFLVGQKGGDRADEILLSVVREDPAKEVRAQAVFWLSKVKTDRAAEALAEIVRSESDPELQQRAVFALSQHGGERALQVLREYALDESKPEEQRGQAIFWLAQHRGLGDAAAVRELYGRLDSEELKERVFFAIAQSHAGPETADWLLERAVDPGESPKLRKRALFWAVRAGAPLERVDDLYAGVDDPEMKEQILFAYMQRKGPEGVERLIEVARTEEDPELRKKAIFWLGQSGDPRAAEFLVELLERRP